MESPSKSKPEDAEERNAQEWPTNRQKQTRTSRSSSTQEGPAMSLQKQGETESGDEDEENITSGLEDTTETGNSPRTATDNGAYRRNTKRFRYGIETYAVGCYR